MLSIAKQQVLLTCITGKVKQEETGCLGPSTLSTRTDQVYSATSERKPKPSSIFKTIPQINSPKVSLITHL